MKSAGRRVPREPGETGSHYIGCKFEAPQNARGLTKIYSQSLHPMVVLRRGALARLWLIRIEMTRVSAPRARIIRSVERYTT